MKFILGLLLGLVLVPLGIYLYLAGGSAPVATTDSDMPFERFFAHKILDARIARDMPKNVPLPANESNYLPGAELYKQHCAVCHGLPLAPKTAIATGMYPRPPQLFQGKGVTDDEPGETYWKIANGIRLSGMPGFSKSLSETQMWQTALMLANADKLPDSVKAALVTTTASNAPPGLISPVPPPPAYPSSLPPQK
ncbi:MAG TPA: cytochrome c [Terriglobales bacterium]|nr:cytochrome c [Terriglobales bacterium]